jgi:hypothetical protein
MLAHYEDNGWEIPASAMDAAARNVSAQRALLSLIGTIKTETREERERRPLRDYIDGFYADPQVQVEGWFYSVGYRMTDAHREPVTEVASQKEKPGRERQKKELPVAEATNEIATPIASSENPIVSESSAETIEHEPVPEAAEIRTTEE